MRLFACLLFALLPVTGCRPDAPDGGPHTGAPPVIRAALDHPGYDWRTTMTPHFHLHADADSHAAAHLGATAWAMETARTEVLTRLDEPARSEQVEAFFVRDRADLRPLLGRTPGGSTDPAANAVFYTSAPGGGSPLRHELGHLYSWRRWGLPRTYWLSEGVAMYATGDCAGHSLHAWAAALDRAGDLVGMEDLVPFDFKNAAMHLQAGSFVRYVADTHGINALRTLWRGGLDVAIQATGRSAGALEAAWRQRVARETPPAGLDWSGPVQCEQQGLPGGHYVYRLETGRGVAVRTRSLRR